MFLLVYEHMRRERFPVNTIKIDEISASQGPYFESVLSQAALPNLDVCRRTKQV